MLGPLKGWGLSSATQMRPLDTHARTHTHAHTHARTHAETHTHTHTHTRTHAHTRAHAHTRTHTHARSHARAHLWFTRSAPPSHGEAVEMAAYLLRNEGKPVPKA